MRKKKNIILIVSISIIMFLVSGGIIYNNCKVKKQTMIDAEATKATNANDKSIVESTEVVQVSNDLIFELPIDVENFTETQYAELEEFLYEEGWDTISAYYEGIYGENARKVISEIKLEPVKTETIKSTECHDFTDENGNITFKEIHSYQFDTTISYLLHSSRNDVTTARLTIVFSAPIENEKINYNAILHSYISVADESENTEHYILVETWQGDVKLYKKNGFYDVPDEYYDVNSGNWGSDSEDLEKRNKEYEEKQKEYWPASANSSWDNLLNLGARFECDADTDVWYAIVGNRICYWIPTEKEWMTEYEFLFETYYLTSTDGIEYKLYKNFDGRRVWQIGFDRTLASDGSLIVE